MAGKITSVETMELRKRILEYKRGNMSFYEISIREDKSESYIRQQYKKALDAIVVDDIDLLRRTELNKLNHLEADALKILGTFHPILHQGLVVRDIIEVDGNPVLDHEGNPVTVRLQDSGPVLAAMDRLMKIMERRDKLLGLDRPTKVAMTDPSGESEAQSVQFYLPSNGRDEQAG